jgi:hypothetical protein
MSSFHLLGQRVNNIEGDETLLLTEIYKVMLK